MNIIFSLGVGSLLGGFARYLMSGTVIKIFGSNFPHGTPVVNLVGCLIIGVLDEIVLEEFHLTLNARILLMTGFCGAFTTFSTLIIEASDLIKDGALLRA